MGSSKEVHTPEEELGIVHFSARVSGGSGEDGKAASGCPTAPQNFQPSLSTPVPPQMRCVKATGTSSGCSSKAAQQLQVLCVERSCPPCAFPRCLPKLQYSGWVLD